MQTCRKVSAKFDRTPVFEGEFLDCGRQLVDLKHVRMARDIEEPCQYGGLLLIDIPVRPPPPDLEQDDSVAGKFHGLGVRPEVFRGGT